MTTSRLTQLSSHLKRIEYGGLYVDLIETSEGLVRVGSMPDIAKFLVEHDFRAEIVIVPPWEASMAGDNYTGEEFVLWQAQVKNATIKKYIGALDDLNLLYRNLEETFSFYFDNKRLFIEKKSWINNWFSKHPADPTCTIGTLEIKIDEGNIVVSDAGLVLYDRNACASTQNPNRLVEGMLSGAPRVGAPGVGLEVQAVGTGNGFAETVSNCLVRFEDKMIWVDPCGYPAHALSRCGVHWDDVTHLLITHNHEDHIQGVSACLGRAEQTGRPLALLTTPGIHDVLEKQFTPLFPRFSSLVELIPLHPGYPIMVGGIEVVCRLNHHFLPFGTLGLKFSAGGRTFGYSGDTKFDASINAILGRKELEPEWFADCDLLFHEVDFDNPSSVHTYWAQLKVLASAIPGRVLAYHAPRLDNPPLPRVEQGKVYRLDEEPCLQSQSEGSVMIPVLRVPSRPYEAYIFDLDGTVYLGNELLPGAEEAINTLRRAGKRTVFLSNNPTHTRADYADKLTRLGLPTPVEDVINSSVVMVDFLRRELPEGRLYVIGEEPLHNELRTAGFELTDDAQQVDAVVASFDRTFVYRKLQVAFDAIRAGARFFATNADRYCPVPGGGEPDCGAIIAAIEACTDTRVEVMVGKPSVHTAEAILALLELPPESCLMIGDRLETDVRLGLDAGMASALVLSGATDAAALAASDVRPTYVLRGIGDLKPLYE